MTGRLNTFATYSRYCRTIEAWLYYDWNSRMAVIAESKSSIAGSGFRGVGRLGEGGIGV